MSVWRSAVGLGDDETISKNNETINNPAITAPIIICDPLWSCPYPAYTYACEIPFSFSSSAAVFFGFVFGSFGVSSFRIPCARAPYRQERCRCW